MGQSLAQLYVHLVFGTKRRVPWLDDGFRGELHAYLIGILRNLDSPSLATGSVADHVHILLRQSRTLALAKLVEGLKKSSAKWLKAQAHVPPEFAWQAGYGAFSVSSSLVPAVTAYIGGQVEHHQHHTFQDELRAILRLHEVAYDERYLWD